MIKNTFSKIGVILQSFCFHVNICHYVNVLLHFVVLPSHLLQLKTKQQ